MKVSNMVSNKNNPVANQFIISTPDAMYFQSYDTVIVKTTWVEGKRQVYLDKYAWDYSKTTSKYRNQFLGATTKEVKARIKSGEYILTNLNEL